MDCSLPGSSIHGVSPVKNTGVSCHALLQGTFPRGIEPRYPALQVDSLLSEPPGKLKNTRVGSLSLLQGIFLIQKSNQGLLHCRQILYQLSYQGSPRILEWVAYPFSRESFQPRNWTRFTCFAGGFFTSWATRKAHIFSYNTCYSLNSERSCGQ